MVVHHQNLGKMNIATSTFVDDSQSAEDFKMLHTLATQVAGHGLLADGQLPFLKRRGGTDLGLDRQKQKFRGQQIFLIKFFPWLSPKYWVGSCLPCLPGSDAPAVISIHTLHFIFILIFRIQ